MVVPLGVRLIVFILLAAVPVFVVQLLHNLEVRRGQADAILGRAATIANLAAARQDRLVEGARLLLITASHLQSVREKNAEVCSARLRELADRVPELTALAVLTPAGERWCASRPGAPAAANIGDRPYFQETLQRGDLHTSGFILGRETREGSFIFTFPVWGEGGAVESVLLAAYKTSLLSGLLADPGLPGHTVMALVDRHDVIAGRWPEAETWMGRAFPDAPLLALAREQGRGIARIDAPWAGGKDYAVAYAPVQSPTRLLVFAALPLTPALRQAEREFRRAVAWTTAIFTLAAMLAILGAQLTVVRPIRDLRDFADALAGGDLKARPPESKRSASELRALARRFGAMAATLEERQAQVAEAMHQKDMLLKEVNHRVKNSLQLVASLLGLQLSQIKDPEARRQFEEAGRRINTVASIHQRLYQDENVDRVAFDRFLRDLCTDLGSVYGHERITIACDVTPCHLDTGRVIPVALIINELIANAFKYSFPQGASGSIRVDCREEPGAVVTSVSDDGVALPAGFDPGKSAGLGMRMIVALTRQLRGTLGVEPLEPGKRFTLRVPIDDGNAP
ncbi:MAG: HAMP domain-containing protein [Xanthobacteraceae bacterium]|nr:HAMP domain-containing protein [Xanthobacteraceae bacterium]